MRVFLLLFLFVAGKSIACMCAPQNIEQRYESSANVFTAVITSAKFNADGSIESRFEITERFKGDVPFNSLTTKDSGTTCHLSISVGPERLFFLEDDGEFGACSGSRVIVPGVPAPWLELLRAYKRGETPDLSSPWIYREYEGHCSLHTDFLSTRDAVSSSVTLQHGYAEPETAERGDHTVSEVAYSSVVFMLPARDEPEGAQLTVKTAHRDFIAKWAEKVLPGRSRGGFQLTGEDVIAFANELIKSSEVTLEGSLVRYSSLGGTMIRTTNAGTAISDFVGCVNQ